MKPIVLVTQYVDPAVIDLLTTVCDIMPRVSLKHHSRHEISLLCGCAHAVLLATPECIDEAILRHCRKLRVVSCAFKIHEHIDVAACTRRGIWVTNVLTTRRGIEAQLEAARNVLDVMGGDTPRSALNHILQPAA